MKIRGTLDTWDDAKGYGFISPEKGESRIFVHIKAFANRTRRPAVGDVVTYSASTDAQGRPCAEHVKIAGASDPRRGRSTSKMTTQLLAIGFLLLVGSAVLVDAIPMAVLILYLVASAVTFAEFALDKSAAKSGAWRTREKRLHLLSLIGGWPGALIAQTWLRHKSRKRSFRAVFWITVVLNCGAFAWLFTPGGARLVASIVEALP